MEVVAFFLWLGLAIIVAVAADTRGRDGAGWFFLAVLISLFLSRCSYLAVLISLFLSRCSYLAVLISLLPAGLLLLALPRKEKIPGHGVHFSEALPGGGERRETRRTQEQLEQDRCEGVFRPDGMIENTPYRVLPNGKAEAMIQGGIVRFHHEANNSSIGNVNH